MVFLLVRVHNFLDGSNGDSFLWSFPNTVIYVLGVLFVILAGGCLFAIIDLVFLKRKGKRLF